MADEIKDRPKVFEQMPFYSILPQLPLGLDLSTIHDFLLYDIYDLDGVQPIEARRWPKPGEGFITVQPPDHVLDEYIQEKIIFQIIHVVINAFSFKEINGNIIGKPYSISLLPWSKRDKVTEVNPASFKGLNLESINKRKVAYMGFNPFSGQTGFYGDYNIFTRHGPYEIYTDMVGLVYSTYALASKWDIDDVVFPEVQGSNDYLREKYRKYRMKRYFKKFDYVKPRKIWGCDSPIELFLLYAMSNIGLQPEIQTSIYEDGSIYPSLHHMISENRSKDKTRIITDVDFYFPNEKIAIFCDSNFHRGKEKKDKDARIDRLLNEYGVNSCRIQGRNIISDPFKCADIIRRRLAV